MYYSAKDVDYFFKNAFRECVGQETAVFACKTGYPVGVACPNCGGQLLRVLSVPKAAIVAITDGKLDQPVDLMFCWKCRASSSLWYDGNLSDGLRFHLWNKGTEGYPILDPYPECFEEHEIFFCSQPPEERRFLEDYYEYESNEGKEYVDASQYGLSRDIELPINQLGGVPLLFQGPQIDICIRCETKMHILGTMADHNGSETGYFDDAGVAMVFNICTRCKMIHAFHIV